MTKHTPLDRPATLREKIAQLVFVRIGSNLPPIKTVEEDESAITDLLSECPIGGFVLFNGRWPATQETLARLQKVSEFPLLVASDIERGVGQQVHGLSVYPHAMAFDHLGAEAEAMVEGFARASAAEARECGIHISFAPVADVNTDPRNPIIATRAFSQDPERAAALVSAYVRAAEAEGLLTTPKHFPGHGNTHQDSHDSLPIVELDRSELEACDLVPFRRAIDAGASVIMTAHVAYPKLDPSGRPATLSRPVLTELLRNEMGFEGVICTDSLLMAGVQQGFDSESELALAALEAGADILLDVASPAEVVESLTQAAESGRIAEERIDEAFERIWQLKERVFSGGKSNREVASEAASPEPVFPEAVARRAIIPCDSSSQLPHYSADDDIMLLLLSSGVATLEAGEQPIAEALRARFPNAQYAEVGPDAEDNDLADLTAQALAADKLVIAMIVKPAAWHRFGLTDPQEKLVHQLTQSRDALLVSLGVPYVLDNFENASSRWCTFSDVPASQQAIVDWLAGVESSSQEIGI